MMYFDNKKRPSLKGKRTLIDSYELKVNDIIIDVAISSYENETVPIYETSITNITPTTKVILEKIREEFVSQDTESLKKADDLEIQNIQGQYKAGILELLTKYFPTANKKTMDMLINYVLQQNIGLGNIEILLKDRQIPNDLNDELSNIMSQFEQAQYAANSFSEFRKDQLYKASQTVIANLEKQLK